MNKIEEEFLQIFKRIRIGRNAIVMLQTIDIELEKWDFETREQVGNAYENLAKNLYITFDKGKYKLLDKGFDYLYSDHNIQQTKQLILDKFKLANLRSGDLLSTNIIMMTRSDVDAFHQENFSVALEELLVDNLIVQDSKGFRLTDEGYSANE